MKIHVLDDLVVVVSLRSLFNKGCIFLQDVDDNHRVTAVHYRILRIKNFASGEALTGVSSHRSDFKALKNFSASRNASDAASERDKCRTT